MIFGVEKMAARTVDGPKKSIPNKKEGLHIIIYISLLLLKAPSRSCPGSPLLASP